MSKSKNCSQFARLFDLTPLRFGQKMKYFFMLESTYYLKLVVVHFVSMNMMIYGSKYFFGDNNIKVLFLKIGGT